MEPDSNNKISYEVVKEFISGVDDSDNKLSRDRYYLCEVNGVGNFDPFLLNEIVKKYGGQENLGLCSAEELDKLSSNAHDVFWMEVALGFSQISEDVENYPIERKLLDFFKDIPSLTGMSMIDYSELVSRNAYVFVNKARGVTVPVDSELVALFKVLVKYCLGNYERLRLIQQDSRNEYNKLRGPIMKSTDMFKQYCEDHGWSVQIMQGGSKTHTAKDSAENYDVGLNQIVKSLLLCVGDKFMIFLVPGDKRLDFDILKERFGKEVRMATAEEVKDVTGYSIGGVPPFGHKNKLETHIEAGFPVEGELLAAAGNVESVFKTSLDNLIKYTSATTK